MDVVARRRQSTLDFFKSIESYGAHSCEPSAQSTYPTDHVARSKHRKSWAVSRNIGKDSLGKVIIREPLLITASPRGSPMVLSSCISYVSYEMDKHIHGSEDSLIDIFHPGLDDLGKTKKSESYKHLLAQRSTSASSVSDDLSELSSFSSISTSSSSDQSRRIPDHYDPLFLDDPELTTGRHKTIVNLSGYISSIIHYAGEDEIKRELNERFAEMHPYIHPSMSLSKIRNLKRTLLKSAISCGLELVSVAIAYALLEKLILAGHVVKANRRVCGAGCLLLSAKVCDLKESDISRLLDYMSSAFHVSSTDILRAEFPVFVSLSFSIHIPPFEYLPHFERIFSDLDYCNFQEYLGERMYSVWTKDSDYK